jgi:UDP-N-acetylglucosamine acyltransferase
VIHPTAIIDPCAKLDADVSVGPYSIIGADVEVGAGTEIGPHVVLKGPMRIGRNNHIFQFCSLGEISQDKTAKVDDATAVEIGDGNTIREYVTIQRGTLKDTGITRVGNDNLLMNHVHIAHDCVVGDNVILANGTTLAGHVSIEDWVILGGATLVHQFCQLGAHCFTAGGAVVLRDVPPYVMSEGQPASPRGVNKEGLRRRGFSAAQIEEVESIYRLLYRSGKLMAEVKTTLAERAEASEIAAGMLAFLERSRRAIQR